MVNPDTGPATGSLLSPDGRAALAYGKDRTFVVCIGKSSAAVGNAVNGADGIVNAVWDDVIAAGGKVPEGMTQGLLGGSTPVTISNGWWLGDVIVPNGDRATQPDGMTIFFTNDSSGQGGAQVFSWPGTRKTVGLSGQQLVDACAAADPQVTEAARIVTTTAGHGLLVIGTDGRILVCSSSESGTIMGSDADSHGVVSVGASSGFAGSTSVFGGKLPDGVTAVSVRTPHGVQKATISDGYWVAEDQVTVGTELLEPEKLLVTMSGEKPQSFWIDWKVLDAATRADRDRSLPSLYTGSELVQACTVDRAGSAVARSLPGHVVYLDGKQPRVCVAGNNAGASFAYSTPAGALNPTKQQFAVASSFEEFGAGQFYGGGELPAGVTSVVFHTRDGDIPATTSDGRWVYEQQMVVFDKAARPTSVTLSGPGGTKTINLG